ncbi:hypothetical protein M4L90_12160 [Staphylococcus equorum]|uniref:Uncharacterized protein n=1 Tax=Staphylococcus equorum TaxID=246432 RepID=A0A9X4L6H9_9STAP|nr:hypothetical protein [Staphylococcus equorum]MDG0820673.1 hypothetical protein [Staphylococcus equorum]MDG0841298.1 hypothetical protein [Staphylococcus equorum]MDG0846998.1 hypothetical protein [Staphylococcus equorum]
MEVNDRVKITDVDNYEYEYYDVEPLSKPYLAKSTFKVIGRELLDETEDGTIYQYELVNIADSKILELQIDGYAMEQV